MLIILGGGAVYVLSTNSAPEAASSTTSTQFSTNAAAVVSGAIITNPVGYVLESSKGSPQQNSDWAVLGQSDGSVANLTALVFNSTDGSQSYVSRFVSSIKGLPGYTDITSSLGKYQQYGRYYGYGEDVDGIAVADGVCTKGNVFLQVHTVSSKDFDSLQADMASLKGALYQNVA